MYQNSRSIWVLTQNAICVMGPWFMVSWRDGRLTSLSATQHHIQQSYSWRGQGRLCSCVVSVWTKDVAGCWVGVFYAKFDNIQCLLFSVMRIGAGPAAARRGRGTLRLWSTQSADLQDPGPGGHRAEQHHSSPVFLTSCPRNHQDQDAQEKWPFYIFTSILPILEVPLSFFG